MNEPFASGRALSLADLAELYSAAPAYPQRTLADLDYAGRRFAEMRPPAVAPSAVGERGPSPARPGPITPNELLAREKLRDYDATSQVRQDFISRLMRQLAGPSPAY